MRRHHAWLAVGAGLAVVLGCAGGGAKAPPKDLLGVALQMDYDAVQGHLASSGALHNSESGARGAKQVWKIGDGPYEWLSIRFDPDMRVEWVSAFAREGETGPRYHDIADTTAARKQGLYFYTWTVQSGANAPYAVVARGTDPTYLTSVSIYGLPPAGAAPDPADVTPERP